MTYKRHVNLRLKPKRGRIMRLTYDYLTDTCFTLLIPKIGVDEYLLNQREVKACLLI